MARASAAAENAGLNGLDGTAGATNRVAYVSLHTADPGTTGANEMASCPRQAVSWNAASGGSKTNSNALAFTNSGTSAANYWGTWDASSGGNYSVGGALTSPVTAATINIAIAQLSLSLS